MKKLFILIALLFPFFMNAQYQVELDLKTNTAKAFDAAKEEIPLTEVINEKPINVTIKFDDKNFKSITYFYFDDNGNVQSKTVQASELGLTKKNTSYSFDILLGKPKINGETQHLDYPYKFILEKNDNSKWEDIIIGGEPIDYNLNLFKNIDWRTHTPTSVEDIIDNITLERKNVVMLIDCSPSAQSNSILYRKGKRKNAEKKRVRYLRRGDYLKVYLYNINKYKYQVEINDVQEDFSYGRDSYLDSLIKAKTTGSKSTASAVSTAGESEQKSTMETILKYSAAVDSIKIFIAHSKNQSFPSSEQLEQNKRQIEFNLINARLFSSSEIEKLYDSLDDNTKEEIKKEYENAKKFSSTLDELKNLSYTIEGTLLPIQVKSYDQLKLTVTLKDKNGGTVGKPRDYIHQIIGGIKVDQSFGFVGHGLFNEEYTLKDSIFKQTTLAMQSNGEPIQIMNPDGTFRDSIASIMDVTKKKILEDTSSSQISLGVTTLTHFYYRLGFFNIGPQIGFSVDVFPEQNIRYLAGGSIMFADGRHRVSLDVGVAFGKVQQLSSVYKVGDFLEGTNAAVPLVDKSKRAWYFGISYNVPLIKKETQLVNGDD